MLGLLVNCLDIKGLEMRVFILAITQCATKMNMHLDCRLRLSMTRTEERTETRYGGYRGGNILEFSIKEFRPQPSPIALFRQHLVQWFFVAKLLRFFEVVKLSEKPTKDDLASHRMVCSALITFGEFASIFSKQNKQEVNLEALGFSVESIEAETRMLRDNFKMFHDTTISYAEAEAVLKNAFNEA